jgi:hypothetical protein
MTALPMIIVERIETLPALPAADIERAADFARQAKSPATRAAYRSDFAAFQTWCSSRGVTSLPSLPETVAGFLASEADAGRRHGAVLLDSEAGGARSDGLPRLVHSAPARR